MKFNFHVLNKPSDPEKAVLPAVIFIKRVETDVGGFMLAIGWWHWALAVSCMWLRANTPAPEG